MNQHYIRGVRLSTPVEKNSYLQTLPAVQALAAGPGLEFTRDVTFLFHFPQKFLCRDAEKFGQCHQVGGAGVGFSGIT